MIVVDGLALLDGQAAFRVERKPDHLVLVCRGCEGRGTVDPAVDQVLVVHADACILAEEIARSSKPFFLILDGRTHAFYHARRRDLA